MPTVPDIALCSKLCRHNPTDPTQNKGGRVPEPLPLDPPLQIDKYKEITGFDIQSRHWMIYIMFSNKWQHNIERHCIILSWKNVDQISSIYLSWGVQCQAGTCSRSNITTTWFDCALSCIAWQILATPILDTTPLNTRLRVVYLQL